MRTFQFSDAKSHKFWNIDAQGTSFTVSFGRIGTTGQTQTKSFPTPEAAQAAADKLIAEKTKKGYVETTPKAVAPEAEAFEKALIENPDDLAGWCAYADYLVERDDPRGEFMQVQIALEDEKRPKKERDALKKKEKAILEKYEREWLGGLAAFVFEEKSDDDREDGLEHYPTRVTCAWQRGVISSVTVGRLSMALAQVLAVAPAAQFVRELHVHDTMLGYYGEDVPDQPRPRRKTPKGLDRHNELFELIGSPLLANLRHFQMGHEIPNVDGWCDCGVYVRGLEHVVASMSRVEVLDLYCKSYRTGPMFALPNLTHLRELRLYHLGGREWQGISPVYRLDLLAKNSAFANLTHLLFHPHQSEDSNEDHTDMSYLPLEQVRALLRSPHLKKLRHLQLRLSDMGDDGIRAIVDSGILKQLVWLDLQHGCVTDDGANLLAACPDAKRLERIDLSRNAVSAKSLAALRKAGVNAVANNPLTANELAERQYLREGDFE
ncbi:WGR domain-containing protein [Frigoriglobus tundricola]|uniref:WGR domain-containing protein n=1 Tax=Frigoriglobus tundricola TaxID=2774151 RepID=A0A6M5YWD8_9BACT|nr:WGR domain-containing protein [Frigoriglobus tundricola]QJW97774.1 hypothetical protein FTUN_5354 [Frigoriglobus tundricola]